MCLGILQGHEELSVECSVPGILRGFPGEGSVRVGNQLPFTFKYKIRGQIYLKILIYFNIYIVRE